MSSERRRVVAHGRVQGVFFRDSTRREADRRGVAGWARNTAEGNDLGVSYLDYRDWRAQTRSFASLAGYQPITMNISDSGHPPERAIRCVPRQD